MCIVETDKKELKFLLWYTERYQTPTLLEGFTAIEMTGSGTWIDS